MVSLQDGALGPRIQAPGTTLIEPLESQMENPVSSHTILGRRILESAKCGVRYRIQLRAGRKGREKGSGS